MSVAFSSDSEQVIKRNIVDECKPQQNQDAYDIDRCARWILTNKYEKVCLQFPDPLLCDAADVAVAIERRTGVKPYILGDTSYGSCCVDEVAAEHMEADCVIHFGDACLSPVSRLPVLYILPRLPLDVSAAVIELRKVLPAGEASTKYMLVCDVAYSYLQESLLKELSSHCSSMKACQLEILQKEDYEGLKALGRIFPLSSDETMAEYTLVWIGEENRALTSILFTFSSSPCISYCPERNSSRVEGTHINKQLMKRYYLIERIRDAKRLGILIGTLGVSGYLDTVHHLQKLIKASGKRCYTISVGKLNTEKLANFAEIEAFVIIACPQNSLLDSKELYQPVVTPWELELALRSDREWTGQYKLDLDHLNSDTSENFEGKIRDSPDVSLISGQIRGVTVKDENSSTWLITQQLSVVHQGGAGEYLATRSWQGLEQKLGEAKVQEATEGQKGIASSYINET